MTREIRILLSMGTRPEIIKMLPVYFALKERGVAPMILHTGQHSDMAEALYELFGVKPDYNIILERKASGKACDLAALSSELLLKSSGVIAEAKPDIVLVHGDTSTALMVALAAFYNQCRIGHVEAGLRSFNEYSPFPEEKNRVLIARLAHWHFAPTPRAAENLRSENIADHQIYIVGNTIVEAAKIGLQRLQAYRSGMGIVAGDKPDLIGKLEKFLPASKIVLVTAHRRENHDYNIRSIAAAVLELMEAYPDMVVVWPVHPNPKVKQQIHEAFESLPNSVARRLYLTAPLSYPVLLWVLKEAWLVMTDSGGIQEEAVAVQTPVFVLRDTTERPEVIETGAGELIGANKESIIDAFSCLYDSPEKHKAMRSTENPFGDGNAATRICNLLLKHYAS